MRRSPPFILFDYTYRSNQKLNKTSGFTSSSQRVRGRGASVGGGGSVGWDAKRSNEVGLVYGTWSLSSRFVVVDKPSSIPIADPDPQTDTLERRIKNLIKLNSTNQITSTDDIKLYFPHRIDKFTSGLMVVAFDQQTASQLGRSLQNKEWTKRYRVLTEIPSCLVMDELGESIVNRDVYQYRYGERSYRLTCGCCSNDIRGTGLLNKCNKCSGLWKCRCDKPTSSSSSSLTTTTTINDNISRLKSRLLSRGYLESNIYRRDDTNNLSNTISSSNSNRSREKNIKLIPPSCQYCVDSVEYKTTEHPFIAKYFLYSSGKNNNNNNSNSSSLSTSSLSKTEYQLSDVFKSTKDNRYYSLYDVQLLTGKTHQVRIHFSDSGFPIKDDPYYNPFTIKYLNSILKLNQQQQQNQQKKPNIKSISNKNNNNNNHNNNNDNNEESLNLDLKGVTINMGLQSYSLGLPNPFGGAFLQFSIPPPLQWDLPTPPPTFNSSSSSSSNLTDNPNRHNQRW